MLCAEDAWKTSDRAFEEFHGLDRPTEEEEDRREREIERRLDIDMERRGRKERV